MLVKLVGCNVICWRQMTLYSYIFNSIYTFWAARQKNINRLLENTDAGIRLLGVHFFIAQNPLIQNVQTVCDSNAKMCKPFFWTWWSLMYFTDFVTGAQLDSRSHLFPLQSTVTQIPCTFSSMYVCIGVYFFFNLNAPCFLLNRVVQKCLSCDSILWELPEILSEV